MLKARKRPVMKYLVREMVEDGRLYPVYVQYAYERPREVMLDPFDSMEFALAILSDLQHNLLNPKNICIIPTIAWED